MRWVKREKLRPLIGIPTSISTALAAQIPALRDVSLLTPDALVLLALSHPPLVIPQGNHFQVVGNIRIAQCLSALPADQRIPVVVAPKMKDKQARQTILQVSMLGSLAYGFDAVVARQSLLAVWKRMDSATRSQISPQLHTKSGFAALAGINRRAKLPEAVDVPSRFKQLGFFEGNE